jgi:hypothetical protein
VFRAHFLGWAAVLTVLGGAAGVAEAGPLWSYQWQPTTPYIHSDPVLWPLKGGPIPVDPPPWWHWPPSAGQAGLLLIAPPFGSSSATHLDKLPAVEVLPLSWAPDNLPGKFTHAAWGLRLTIFDNLLHRAGTLLFTGFFDGTLSRHTADLTSHFTSSADQFLTLGGPFIFDIFEVKLKPFVPPGPPNKNQPGWFYAEVDVNRIAAAAASAPPMCAMPTPEPSTLVLAGLALAGGGVWLRRRREA